MSDEYELTNDNNLLRNNTELYKLYKYKNPLNSRYASKEMSYIFSDHNKITIWRKLWTDLAETQKSLGIECISDIAINEMKKQKSNIDFEKIQEYEQKYRHDVMANVYAFGDVAPNAKGIIHLGATSCYVTDNADLIMIRSGLGLLIQKLEKTISIFANFCNKYKDIPTLGYTHFQAAQLTTVGKRGCLWLQDLLSDYNTLINFKDAMKFRGVKGTTGTQASFLKLFNDNHQLVDKLDTILTKKYKFHNKYVITGQTYPRKLDDQLLSALASFGASCHKFATDIRLLSHLKEVDEPFESEQIGSSAMAYKRNPMRSERICGLSRYLMSLSQNTQQTAALQWFERTLDDSSNRRICIPEAFITADIILTLVTNVISQLVIYPNVIHKHVYEELPFMVTENIIMEMVSMNEDRQVCHEKLMDLSRRAHYEMKYNGKQNPLLEYIRGDEYFKPIHEKLPELLDSKLFIGRSAEQVTEFLQKEVEPIVRIRGPVYFDAINN